MAKAPKPEVAARKKPERSTTDLTQTICEKAKPEAKQVCIWDARLRGFCLRITPQRIKKVGTKEGKIGGAKSFWLKLSRTRKDSEGAKTVQATWVRIGTFMAGGGLDLTVEVARKRAQNLKDTHEQGGDVRAIREERNNPDDVAALVKAYKAHRAFTKLRASTQAALNSYLRNYIEPKLGKRYVRDLSERDIEKIYDHVLKATSTTTANRVLALLSVLMKFAEKEKMRPKDTNPCKGFDKGDPEVARTRTLTPLELKALGITLNAAVIAWNTKPRPKDACSINEVSAAALRFLALTGLRLGEVLPLRWKDLDMEAATMTFEFHKTSKTKGSKTLPIPPEAMSILNGLKQDYDDEAKKLRAERKPVHMNPFVFRGHKIGHHLVGLERVWLRVREASGLDSTAKKGEVRLHDFRRTYHTVCMELGYPGGVGDYLLGHSLGKIRDTYTNLSAEGILAQAAIEISGWIGAAMAGREPVTGKKVSHAQA